MDFEKYTERARGFLQAAQTMALARGHQRFAPEHLLKVLIDDPEGMAAGLIKAAGGQPQVAKQKNNEDALAKMPKVEGGGAGQLYLAPEMARLFETADKLREKAGDSFVAAERLLQALALSTGSPAADALKAAGVTPQSLETAIQDMRKGRKADSASAEQAYDALKKYARDLTEAAESGKLDPVIGRDEEIRRTIDRKSTRLNSSN